MSRPKGNKNVRTSRYDITKMSIETIQEAIDIFLTQIKTDALSTEQKEEVLHLYNKMVKLLKDGSHHLNKDYKW